MYYSVRFFTVIDGQRKHDMSIRTDNYADALKISREYDQHDIAMVFDSHGQYIISRSLPDGELCREDEL